MYQNYSIKEELFSNLKLDYPLKNWLETPLSKILSIDTLEKLYQLTQKAEGNTFIEKILNTFNLSLQILETDLKKIPRDGACIVIANHPYGGLEGILLASVLEKIRPDFKIMANYFIGLIPELRDMFIFVDPFAGKNSKAKNIAPLKNAMRVLKNNGLLVIFPSGAVSHFKISEGIITDPPWQKNMGRLIEKAEVPVLPVFFSGANRLPFQTIGFIHPILRTLMLPGELANKRNMKFEMRIGSAISWKKLSKYPGISEKLDYLRKRTYNLANRDHMGKKEQSNQNKTTLDIIPAVQQDNLITEYKKIPLAQILYTQKNQTAFYASAYQIPNFIREIGRLREITFREVNEGTGQALDLDHYDDYYLHLIAWDEQENKIIGAYRMGLSDLILQDFGKKGLYTYSLFKMKSAYFKQLQPAIELGRSFIVSEY